MMTAPVFDLFEPIVAKPLRPHQERSLAELRASVGRDKKRRPVLKLPTGAGKTRVAAELTKGGRAKGKRIAFTVPAISLINQTVEAFEAEGIFEIGVIQANHPRTDYSQPVQIVSVQSLVKRVPPEADIVIVDECHVQYKVITDWMKAKPETIFIGLSATPWAKGMGDNYDDLIAPVSMQELIDAGYLSPFRVFAPSHPDLSGVKTRNGDYVEDQLAEVMSQTGLVADIVETWLQRARGLPTLVFAVNRDHAAVLVDQFADCGVRMGYCDMNVDLIERKLLFDQMARGEIAGIVNIATLTTGVDADVRCIVMARPTKSEMLFVQCIGRGLRTAEGKTECLILDHADNHERMGFVTDIHYDHLLKGGERKKPNAKDRGEPLPKECGVCKALKPPKVRICPSCGFEPEHRPGEFEVEDGELVELKRKPAKAPKADINEKQSWYSQLLSIAKERGRKEGWASHAYRDKFGVWPHHSLSRLPSSPSSEVRNYVRFKDIAFAKRKNE